MILEDQLGLEQLELLEQATSVGDLVEVFESEEEVRDSLMGRDIRPGDVLVIRNEGPAGGPGSTSS